MLIDRTLEPFVSTAAGQFPVLLLTGARQVGKTTLLKKLAGAERRYVTLDEPLALELAQTDPALFMQRFSPPVLIDEIQYAPSLLLHIKLRVDADRAPGLFWLTGSQQFHLMRGVSESLAGRVAVIQLLGLSRAELTQRNLHAPPFLPDPTQIHERLDAADALDLQSLYRVIWRGAMPEVALNAAMDRELFYSSYVQTYLQRDVRDLARVGDETAFLRFLRACAARTAQMLNLSDLARDADVAPNTAKRFRGLRTPRSQRSSTSQSHVPAISTGPVPIWTLVSNPSSTPSGFRSHIGSAQNPWPTLKPQSTSPAPTAKPTTSSWIFRRKTPIRSRPTLLEQVPGAHHPGATLPPGVMPGARRFFVSQVRLQSDFAGIAVAVQPPHRHSGREAGIQATDGNRPTGTDVPVLALR